MGDKKKKKQGKKMRRGQEDVQVDANMPEPKMGRKERGEVGTDLAAQRCDVLRSSASGSCTIGMLERRLLERFPLKDAEPWDRTGIVVGDPALPVSGLAIALDPTVEAVRVAKRCGANVLITHHPVFLEPPVCIKPEAPLTIGSQAVVWEAVTQGVTLMDFHTALDVSDEAAHVLPSMLNLEYRHIVDVVHEESGRGYGQLCSPRSEEAPMSLRTLGARCVSVFGRQPRMWGSIDARMRTIVTCTGSASDLTSLCVERGYDCLVCGEVRYHDALAASQAGLCIVELGHDVSELPLCALLAATVEKLGFSEDSIKVIDQGSNWSVPEAIRK